MQHVASLLAAPDQEVVAAALQTIQVLLRKTHHTSVRWTPPAGISKRLLALSKGWGGKEEVSMCMSLTDVHLYSSDWQPQLPRGGSVTLQATASLQLRPCASIVLTPVPCLQVASMLATFKHTFKHDVWCIVPAGPGPGGVQLI